MSQLDNPIPPEIFNDELYNLLKEIASKSDVKHILEIGSSTGEGSTSAIVKGMRLNPNNPSLFCIELSKTRYRELKNRYLNEPNIQCLNASSVFINDFPSEQTVVEFYHSINSALNNYPLDTVIGWLRQDRDYIITNNIEQGAIRLIKERYGIEHFDMVLIDGSEFTGEAELREVYGARYIVLDDIKGFKNYTNFKRLSKDNYYSLIHLNPDLRNGYAIFKMDRYNVVAHKVEAIEGYLMPGQERYLFEKVSSLPLDATIVEIGSYKGRSTVAMAYACVSTNRTIYCIDTFSGNETDFKANDFFSHWLKNIKENNLDQYVIPLRGRSVNMIKRLREEGVKIDFAFIDGSHQFIDVLRDFEGLYPLMKDGGQIAFHDVIDTWQGPFQFWHSIAKHVLTNHEYCGSIATGIVNNKKQRLPTKLLTIHFFTIVLNGMPFIRYHIEAFSKLPFKWHWHIVEGVSAHRHDTAWSLQFGAKITDDFHKEGRSIDGTTEYIDELKRQYPENITVYRKPKGEFWDGKREMVNAPLKDISEECLLFQIDVDELWTVSQLCAVEAMFRTQPERTSAYYYCHFFVGKDLIITSKDTYGNNTSYEWLRTWRYKTGDYWASHEPPRLIRKTDSETIDVAKINPFSHSDTRERGLIFQHYAYTTKEQLRFKESYYGYRDAYEKWMRLNNSNQFPVLLKDYFDWVKDFAIVGRVDHSNLTPVAKIEKGQWQFDPFSKIHYPMLESDIKSLLWLSTDSIGDNILRMPSLGQLRQKFKNTSITVLCQEHIAALYEPCPYVDRIITFNRAKAFASGDYMGSILGRLTGFDLAINPVYSSDELTLVIFTTLGAKYKVGFKCDTSNIDKTKLGFYQSFYNELIPVRHFREIDKNKDLLEFFGIKDVEPSLDVWLSQEDIVFREEFFAKNRLDPDKTIALFAGVQFNNRLYYHYGKALSRIANIKDFVILGFGDHNDLQINEQNLQDSGAPYYNLSGKLTLRQTSALLSKCRLAVGAETGLAHIACALEIPNVIVLGGGHFGRFMPYSPNTTIVNNPLECYGCNWHCKYKDFPCIRDIRPEALTRAITEALERPNQNIFKYA